MLILFFLNPLINCKKLDNAIFVYLLRTQHLIRNKTIKVETTIKWTNKDNIYPNSCDSRSTTTDFNNKEW